MSGAAPTVLAGGLSWRTTDAKAREVIRIGVDQIVAVTDEEVAEAICLYFSAKHNVAEGAAALAGGA